MPLEDYANLTDADFRDLPPLVSEGSDREHVLAEVIDGWATQSQDLPRMIANTLYGNFDKIENHPATLKRVDLRDDNPNAELIDLGRDLLIPLAKRVAEQSNTDEGNSTPSNVVVALLGCRIHGIQAEGIDLPAHLVLYGCRVEGRADFSESTFSGNADFGESTFSSEAYFHGSTFSSEAYFHGSTFSGVAYFGGSTFSSEAYFHGSTFSSVADFGRSTFSGNANFFGSTFSGDAYFPGSTFSGYAYFHESTFSDNADFRGSTFSSGTHFYASRFSRAANFAGADLRRAKVSDGPKPLRTDPPARRLRLRLTDRVSWRWVRQTGELTALTRVSYLALIGVPLLAGLWGPARAWIVRQNEALAQTGAELTKLIAKLPKGESFVEELQRLIDGLTSSTLPETMPVGWLLAFLAAFAVVVAQAVYQIRAPDLIRQTSEDELVDRANEINRQDNKITPERLRQAVDYLHTAANAMPHRHSAWFVTRQRRTVWIPNDVDNHFEDAIVDEPKPASEGEDGEDGESITQERATDQEVDAEDRKRIAIEEGQRARYAVAAFETRSAAWVSGGLYLLAGWFSLTLVLRQLGHIAAASPAPWLEWVPWVVTRGPVIVVIAVLIGLSTILGALLVRESWTAARFEQIVD